MSGWDDIKDTDKIISFVDKGGTMYNCNENKVKNSQ
jgi:hypothetical protein